MNCSAGIKIKGVCPSSIVEINYDMRSAYCSLNIQASSPEGGRQRTAANQIFTRLLRRKTRFGYRRPRSRLTIFKPFGHALKIRAFQTNKNRRMYSDRMCKTKASSTQGSFCKPINLIFCGGNAAFFIFSLPGAAEIRHAQSSAALFWERLYSSAVISILETAYSVCPL